MVDSFDDLLKSFKVDLASSSAKPFNVGGKPQSRTREEIISQKSQVIKARKERQSKVKLDIKGFQNVPRPQRPIQLPKFGAGFTKFSAVNKASTSVKGTPLVTGNFDILSKLRDFLRGGLNK